MVGWWACEVTIILTYNKPFSAFWNEDQSGLTSNQLAEKRMKGCFVHAYNKLDRPMRRRSPYMGQWYTIQHGYPCFIWHFFQIFFKIQIYIALSFILTVKLHFLYFKRELNQRIQSQSHDLNGSKETNQKSKHYIVN